MKGISTTGDGLTKSSATSNPTRINMISVPERWFHLSEASASIGFGFDVSDADCNGSGVAVQARWRHDGMITHHFPGMLSMFRRICGVLLFLWMASATVMAIRDFDSK